MLFKGQFDANKMYASELVALLLQMSETAKKKLTEKVDGIDMLLRVSSIRLFPASVSSWQKVTTYANVIEGIGSIQKT